MGKEDPELSGLFKLYKQAIANVPILRYSRVLIATTLILAIVAYFKLENATVFLYAIGVIIISFLSFIFSLFLKNNDPIVKFLRYILVSCIVVTTATAILGFGFFIIWNKPKFYSRWFPDQNVPKSDTSKNLVHPPDSAQKNENITNPFPQKKDHFQKPEIETLSIQLKEETEGYLKIFVNGKQIPVLAESTKFNPRIEFSNDFLNKELLIITIKGDSCTTLLPSHINPSIIRFIPNCK